MAISSTKKRCTDHNQTQLCDIKLKQKQQQNPRNILWYSNEKKEKIPRWINTLLHKPKANVTDGFNMTHYTRSERDDYIVSLIYVNSKNWTLNVFIIPSLGSKSRFYFSIFCLPGFHIDFAYYSKFDCVSQQLIRHKHLCYQGSC